MLSNEYVSKFKVFTYICIYYITCIESTWSLSKTFSIIAIEVAPLPILIKFYMD